MIAPANDAPPPSPIYNLPDLKRHPHVQTTLELYQILVEAVQVHIPVPKHDTLSLLKALAFLLWHSCLLNLPL